MRRQIRPLLLPKPRVRILSGPEPCLSHATDFVAMAGYNGEDQSAEINLAVWALVSVSALFLFARLWCRQRFAQMWWDDLVLTVSWVGYGSIATVHLPRHISLTSVLPRSSC